MEKSTLRQSSQRRRSGTIGYGKRRSRVSKPLQPFATFHSEHQEHSVSHLDVIFLTGLEFYGFHGASDEEQAIGHRYLVDVRLSVDTRPAAGSDRVIDTVNYAKVAETIVRVGGGEQCRLLETLAQRMADRILADYRRVEAVELSLQKLMPPVNAI